MTWPAPRTIRWPGPKTYERYRRTYIGNRPISEVVNEQYFVKMEHTVHGNRIEEVPHG